MLLFELPARADLALMGTFSGSITSDSGDSMNVTFSQGDHFSGSFIVAAPPVNIPANWQAVDFFPHTNDFYQVSDGSQRTFASSTLDDISIRAAVPGFDTSPTGLVVNGHWGNADQQWVYLLDQQKPFDYSGPVFADSSYFGSKYVVFQGPTGNQIHGTIDDVQLTLVDLPEPSTLTIAVLASLTGLGFYIGRRHHRGLGVAVRLESACAAISKLPRWKLPMRPNVI
jgi:hypothetical protein